MKKLNLSLIIALLRSQLIHWESKTVWSVRFILFGILSVITAQMMRLLEQLPDNYLETMVQIIFEPWGWLADFIIVSVALQTLLYSVISARLFKLLLNW